MFVYGFAGPYDWIIVVVFLALIAALIIWGVWRAIGAMGRWLGLTRRTQLAVGGVLAAVTCATAIWLRIDRLDAMERTCQDEVMKHERLSDSSHFEITKHVNFWNQPVSGYWGISRPYEEPKVFLWIEYIKDGRKHQAFLTCRYAKIPNSGNPPQVRFEKIEPWWPNVLSEQNAWVPAERPRR